MALASGIFPDTLEQILDPTQAAVNLETAGVKVAMFNDTPTPDFAAPNAYGSGIWATNELISGGVWPTGGVAATTPDVDVVTVGGTPALAFTMANIVADPVTFVNAAGYLIYFDTTSPKYAIACVRFQTLLNITAGALTIPMPALGVGGIFRINAY